MNENNNNKFESQKTLKIFFIKLISILVAVVVAINLLFNLIFAERLEKIDKILLLNKSGFREEMKMKIRKELNKDLNKENSIAEEDKILLYKFYMKLRKEFQDLDKSKL
jgi:hypothetical protein|tara:strand:- start:2845 stop:3171 length:327 start_codon:yes stop_codon:yes gene_type:complete